MPHDYVVVLKADIDEDELLWFYNGVYFVKDLNRAQCFSQSRACTIVRELSVSPDDGVLSVYNINCRSLQTSTLKTADSGTIETTLFANKGGHRTTINANTITCSAFSPQTNLSSPH